MSGLDPKQRNRLDQFIDRLLQPTEVLADDYAETHSGMAKALLGCRHRWSALDLAYLRWAACGGADTQHDYPRLERLLCQARDHAA